MAKGSGIDTPATGTVSSGFNNPGHYTNPVGNRSGNSLDTPAAETIRSNFRRVDGALESHPINSESGKGLSKGNVIDSPADGTVTKGS